MTKHTFKLLRRDGAEQSVDYDPIIVIAGTTAHKLALHKDHLGDWVVSDPKSGAAVVRRITGWYKGCPVSLGKTAKKAARMLAVAEVEALISRIGSDRFNAVLANPKPF